MRALQGLGLATRQEDGWSPERDALLDALLEQYQGPGGEERHFYALESPLELLLRTSQKKRERVWVSADLGPDLIVGWRRPTTLILYLKRFEDFSFGDLVLARGQADANVIVRVPEDTSVFCWIDHRLSVKDADIKVAEHTQMLWDLIDLGGEDRIEGSRLLREWIFNQ
ncbi:MAG: hypothetical protein ACRDJV_00800 [Actinomycetota bacterium]